LPDAIDAVLALIDDPARWPASVKAERTCKALRKALVAAIDVLKTDAPDAQAGLAAGYQVAYQAAGASRPCTFQD
jgi:hypothetical protein